MRFRFSRFLAVFHARNKEFYRDKGALGWSIVFPVLIVVSFGYIFNLDETNLYKAAFFGKTDESQRIIVFHEIHGLSEKQAIQKLEKHSVDLVGRWEKDGSLTYWFNQKSPKSLIAEKLLQSEAWKHASLKLNPIPLSGNKASYVEWLFPGLIAMNVMWMALWGVGWVVVRQRKTGVLKRFKASPLTPSEYLLAQIISRMLILGMTGILVFSLGHLIYPFTTKGSYPALFVMYMAGCFSLSSIGLIIAARMKSDEFASGLLNLLTFPMMFLSEVWFSLEGSADWVQGLARFMPLWHMTDGMRRIILDGASLADVSSSLAVLMAISLVSFFVGSAAFRWT